MTKEQILSLVITVLVIVFILRATKKVLKIVLIIAVLVGGLIAFKVVSPEQITDVKAYIQEHADKLDELNKLAELTENIKITKSDGAIEDISIKLDDKWVSITSVGKIVSIEGDTCVLKVADKEYSITDKNVVNLIKLMYDTSFTTSGINRLKDAVANN